MTVPATTTLAECEAVIERGLTTFIEVGRALQRIRDGRLYLETHGRFEDYCSERWGMTRQHANRTVAAAGVAALVEPMGSTVPLSERVARELIPLKEEPEQLRRAWQEVVEISGDTPPTAKDVHVVVKQYREGPSPALEFTSCPTCGSRVRADRPLRPTNEGGAV